MTETIPPARSLSSIYPCRIQNVPVLFELVLEKYIQLATTYIIITKTIYFSIVIYCYH